jgi:hypothetical protein
MSAEFNKLEQDDDPRALAALLGEIEQLMAAYKEKVRRVRENVLEDRQLIRKAADSLSQQLAELGEDLAGLDMQFANAAQVLSDGAENVAYQVDTDTDALESARHQAESAFETVTATLTASGEQAETAHQALTTAFAASREATSAEQANVSDKATAAIAAIVETDSDVETIQSRVTAFVKDIVGRVEKLQHDLGETHARHTDLAGRTVEEFMQRIEKVVQNDLCTPIEAGAEEIHRALIKEAQASLYGLLGFVGATILQIEQRLLEAMSSMSQERNSLGPVRESLEQLKEPLESVMDQVRSTAGCVGFHP